MVNPGGDGGDGGFSCIMILLVIRRLTCQSTWLLGRDSLSVEGDVQYRIILS